VANSGTATTTALNELIFAADMMRTNTLNPGNNFNTRLSTPDNNIAEDRVVNVAGTYSATANLQSSSRWIMQMVTFRTRRFLHSLPFPPTRVRPRAART
ncbi:MAG: hypothetical protein WAO17_15525, partial [Candidatus Sulfotelmatobacter sp.]